MTKCFTVDHPLMPCAKNVRQSATQDIREYLALRGIDMFHEHFRPIPALAPYIDSFWIIKSSAESGGIRRAWMPADSRATLLLNFADEPRIITDEGATHYISAGATLLGIHNQRFLLEHDGDTYLVAAQFRPGGLASFVRYGVGELAEKTIPLELLWGRAGNRLCEQIHEVNAFVDKLTLYQNALLENFVEAPHHPRILRAVTQIDSVPGNVSVEWLATQANLSQKQFERVFERVVGIMPKRYIRLARFQKLVWWLSRYKGTISWTMLAAKFGYHDHSHMAKDFQAFVGTKPSEFTTATAGIVEIAYGH